MGFAKALIYLIARDFTFEKTQYPADVVAFMNAIGIVLLGSAVIAEGSFGTWVRRWARPILAVACLVYLGWCANRVVGYVRGAGVTDHVETSTIAVSWLWAARGAPLYHTADAAARYSNQYGPALYLVDGLFLRVLGPSVFAAKLAGAALWAAGIVLLYLTFWREGSWFMALAATTYSELCLMLSAGNVACFNLRAEPHLIFWSCVGLFASGLRSRAFAALGCGLAAGFACDLKVHGPLYLLPAFALLAQRHGVRAVAGAAAIAVVAIAFPFIAAPGVSLPLYIGRLAGAAHHGLTLKPFKESLAEGTFVALPVAAALLRLGIDDRLAWRDFLRLNWPLLAAFSAAGALVFVPASKEGAGSHHLMPLYPSLAMILVRALAQPSSPDAEHSRLGRLAKVVALAFVPMAVSTTVTGHHDQMVLARSADAVAREVLSEVEMVQRRFPGKSVAIGYGEDGSASYSSYAVGILRYLPVLRGQPYLLDSVSLMDFQQEGHQISAATRQAIREGVISVWLIPAGDEPFAARSFYKPEAPMFDTEFRRTFQECYSRRFRTGHFDVWVYGGAAENAREQDHQRKAA